jgi:trehalose synthase
VRAGSAAHPGRRIRLEEEAAVARLDEVEVEARSADCLEELIGEERSARFDAMADVTRELLGDRAVINVNSTAKGGGVAELLQTLLAYARGVGVDVRWFVIDGNPGFFDITKRIHNHLYGDRGDGGPLGPEERSVYEKTLHDNADDLHAVVRPGDIVLLHDPQTAALASAARRAGGVVVWRCHVGVDTPNANVERAWRFLRPYLDDVDAHVFSRRAFAPAWVDGDRLHVIAPSIDPFSAKNYEMSPDEAVRVLRYVGLVAGDERPPPAPFVRRDGSRGRIDRHADILQTGPPPPSDVPLVVQASRWDRLKDMEGGMAGFAEHVAGTSDAHLVLAGPSVSGVADDPESARILEDCAVAWRRLPHAQRARIHLACTPMRDPDEVAAIVNALQRHAAVVVQKSLAEGFGLTVAEAMWKSRPIVASGLGGIADQIVDGEHGLLLDDPTDLAAFGSAVRRLLGDPKLAARLGASARRRAAEEFLPDRHLEQWAALLGSAVGT